MQSAALMYYMFCWIWENKQSRHHKHADGYFYHIIIVNFEHIHRNISYKNVVLFTYITPKYIYYKKYIYLNH